METVYFTAMGQKKSAVEYIGQLHVHIESHISIETPTHASEHQEKLMNIYLVAHLVSGIVYKCSDSQKAKLYFSEGLKAVESK